MDSYEARLGYLSGNWIPHSKMQLGVDDAGFRQGVTAVERLRTHGGRLFALDEHLSRWNRSTAELAIAPLPPTDVLESLISELLRRNDGLFVREGDIGVTMFATPGPLGSHTPTFGLHLNRLNHEAIESHRERGQPLVVTAVQQPAGASWPRSIKTRSRIHYYLADRFAQQQQEDSLGVLLDADGSMTETSTCNIAIVANGEIHSPAADRVLPGITQLMVERLAMQSSLPWQKRTITVDELLAADEVLLMGTDGGIWYANSVNARIIGEGIPGPNYMKLRDLYDDLTHGE